MIRAQRQFLSAAAAPLDSLPDVFSSTQGRLRVITLNRPKKYSALRAFFFFFFFFLDLELN